MVQPSEASAAISTKLAGALPSSTRLMASAIGGDPRALERLAAFPKMNAEVEKEGVGPELARCAEQAGIAGSCVDFWQSLRVDYLNQNAIRMKAQSDLARAFSALEIRWAPLNGPPLYAALIGNQDDRRPSDIQILISGDTEAARKACIRLGWKPTLNHPGFERYLDDEGWAWRGLHENGLSLDLYHRFGPWAPNRMNHSFLASFEPDSHLGPTGFRPGLTETYIISAVRLSLSRAPRLLLHWWDLHKIAQAGDAKFAETVHQKSRENSLHVLVGAAAAVTAGLWGAETQYFIARLIKAPPRWEGLALRLCAFFGPHRVPAGVLTLARIFDHRRTRLGSTAILRRFWKHPGIVEAQTPENWPWILRRAAHLARSSTVGTPAPFPERF